MNGSLAIEIKNLSNRFGTHSVHEDLNLEVYSGEILGLIGGSGTGKSVLLRSIIGLHKPQEGQVKLFGKDFLRLDQEDRSEIEKNFGVLFQGGALFSSLTVMENVNFPLIEHWKLSREEAQYLSKVKISLVGLPTDAGSKYPSELSGGMIKRAALARAISLDPKILFLDEPTAGLDPIGAAAFDRLILTLRDAFGLTILLITHDLDTIYTICDRVAVISQKKILVAGPLEKVAATNDPWVKEYFHGPRGRAAKRTSEVSREHH